MKRESVLGIAAIVILTLMIGGCGSDKETLPGDSNTEGVSSVNVTSSGDAGLDSNEVLEEKTTQKDDSEDNIAEDDKAEEDIISPIKEYRIHLPGEFEKMHEAYRTIYKSQTASGKEVYYSLINIPDYSIVYPDESYTVDNAPDITWEFILEDMRAIKFPAGAVKSVCTTDTDEKRQMLGNDVIRRTGTMNLENIGETMEISYAAYYMVTDMQNGDYKQVPVVWIAFSEDTSDETKKYLEEVVDYTYENSEIKEN